MTIVSKAIRNYCNRVVFAGRSGCRGPRARFREPAILPNCESPLLARRTRQTRAIGDVLQRLPRARPLCRASRSAHPTPRDDAAGDATDCGSSPRLSQVSAKALASIVLPWVGPVLSLIRQRRVLSMNEIRFLLSVFALAVAVIPDNPPAKPPRGLTAAIEITEVYDGDTLTGVVKIPVRIRMLDCWAPELNPRHVLDGQRRSDKDLQRERERAEKSRDSLALIAEGKNGTAFIPWDHADRVDDVLTFGRVLAHVWVDGQEKTLSRQQVEAGLASSTKGGPLGR